LGVGFLIQDFGDKQYDWSKKTTNTAHEQKNGMRNELCVNE
jgi:hypothetical protein